MEKEKVISVLKRYKDIEKELQLQERLIAEVEENIKGRENEEELQKELKRLLARKSQGVMLQLEVKKELDKLETKQRIIIYMFYIDGEKWQKIAIKEHYSIRQCKNIRTKAVKNLQVLFEQNENIKKIAG